MARSSTASKTSRPSLGLCLLCACVVVLASCGGSDGAETRAAETETEGVAEVDVDALRALPYLGFSAERAAPGNDGVVHHDADRAYDGYTLYTHRDSCLAELIDMAGEIVKSWQYPSCRHWTNAELVDNGDLVVAGMRRLSDSETHAERLRKSYVLRMSWSGERVWETPLVAHHDVDQTPDGGFATLDAEWRRIPEWKNRRFWHRRIEVRDHGIVRLSADGAILERASMYDMLTSNPAELRLQEIEPAVAAGKRDIDLFHSNSVEWMRHEHLVGRHPVYDLDNVLISVRHQDTVAVIHWPSKQLIWAWGQGEISGPHDATLLDSGNIMIFDNGLARGWSRIIEVDPRTREIVWEYKAPNPTDFFTPSRGGNERLPNGNTLITNSVSGQVFEVTPDGEFVWEFFTPHKNEEGRRATIVRAHRYGADFIRGLLGPIEGEPTATAEAAL